tara:strand:+ start:77 stop:631 length:555 start_codon:yes stop_codon:yes gene_type:complete
MAKYFAEIDSNHLVINTVVCPDHADENWCGQNIKFPSGGSYYKEYSTAKPPAFRKRTANKGATYDSSTDTFINAQPYTSWIKDADNNWKAPIDYPTILTYDKDGEDTKYEIAWDENLGTWKAYTVGAIPGGPYGEHYSWNDGTKAWDLIGEPIVSGQNSLGHLLKNIDNVRGEALQQQHDPLPS